MKKALCFVVAIVLLITALPFAASANEADLCFAVASDLHLNLPAEALEQTNDDPLFWYANRRAAMDNESGFIIDEFLNQCAADESCEYVLISGDLADNGRRIIDEHYAVAEKLKDFEEETGKPVFVINGNHDAGNDSVTTPEKFKEIYADFGYDLALTTDESNCSYTANLGSKYRLIALDSCDHDASTKDGMTTQKLQWVKAQAQQAEEDGRYPILMMHHNLLDHMPLQPIFSGNFIVKNHYATAEMFANWGIKLVFTGHEHCSDAATYTSSLGNVIYDFATTALTMYPLQYRRFVVTDEAITYETKTIDSINTQALAASVSGYTDDMLAAMNSGLNDFALGFLKAGIEYRLALSLSSEKLGVNEDDIFYDLVMTAVNGLTDILEMPLYGDGSVQELAKEYGITIPESSYKNGWDVATSLVAAHYAGGETNELESTDVRLLLRIAALILRTDLPAIGNELFFGAADEIFENLGTADYAAGLAAPGAIFPCAVTPGEYFLLAIASPLIYAFAYDSDGVDDNNGSLPGYGTVSAESNIENIRLNVSNVFAKLVKYFGMVSRYLLKMFMIGI